MKWKCFPEKIPTTYDLVTIKYEDDQEHPAWWTGTQWDSAYKIRKVKVVKWKKPYRERCAGDHKNRR